MMKKSRQGIYLALKESGVDTSLGLRGRRHELGEIDKFLDERWFKMAVGRSPSGIAEILNVSIDEVHATLKNRRSEMIAIAGRMPFEEVMTGGELVDYHVDPYRMLAHFSGRMPNGERKRVTLSKMDCLSILRDMQGGA